MSTRCAHRVLPSRVDVCAMQERRKVVEAGVVVRRLRGESITPQHWANFHRFYLATVEHKWGVRAAPAPCCARTM